jgi:hypothetical protein
MRKKLALKTAKCATIATFISAAFCYRLISLVILRHGVKTLLDNQALEMWNTKLSIT